MQLLVLWFCLSWVQIAMAEPVLARIVAVEEDAILVVTDGKDQNAKLRVPWNRAGASQRLIPGNWIRLWQGEDSDHNQPELRLAPLQPDGFDRDHTGVRARLRWSARNRGLGGGRGGR